ncbi:chaperone DNAJ protein, putative [Trypanosoma cruzi]|nr:chaperone DNAJ protein, putative [Trypanosoma cruzi]
MRRSEMTGELEKSRRLYQTLLLPNFSSIEEVRQAYKALALKYHPDKNLNDPSAAEKFRDVRVAYEILSSLERKQKYDCTLRLHQPLGANSFSTGIRTPRAGYTSDVGCKSYTMPGNATSNIYEELNSYAARKAGERQRRTSSAATPRGDRASQYTKEQKEFFRKREKEHQANIRKRREQEKREQIARDLEALRREQERREEILQRSQQLRTGNENRRACASAGIRRASPFPRAASENTPQGGTNKEVPKVFLARDIHSAAVLPDTVRPIPSPRPRRPFCGANEDRGERLRQEKERQAEVRRAEQEKYLERLMRQRMREARLKERELEAVERRERENLRRILFLDEKSEREQLFEPQEKMERRRIWMEHKLSIRNCVLRSGLRRTVEKEEANREFLLSLQEEQFEFLYLQKKESWGRASCRMDEDLSWKQLKSHHKEIQRVIFMREQKEIMCTYCMEFEALRFTEAMTFALIEVQRQEHVNRLQLIEEFHDYCRLHYGLLQELLANGLMEGALIVERTLLINEEESARALLLLELHEWRDRHALEKDELSEVLNLIKQRASERHANHLKEVKQTRIAERRAKEATIAALQVEIRHLQRAMRAASLTVSPGGERGGFVENLPCGVEFLGEEGIDTVARSSLDLRCGALRDKDATVSNGGSRHCRSWQ